MTDELLVQLFYAAQGDITRFRVKAREILAEGGKSEAVGEIAHDEVNGFHFAPSVHWLQIGIGTKLYATLPAGCEPREALQFKEALHDRLNQYPIPTQLGVVAIMKLIEQVYAAIEQAGKEKA